MRSRGLQDSRQTHRGSLFVLCRMRNNYLHFLSQEEGAVSGGDTGIKGVGKPRLHSLPSRRLSRKETKLYPNTVAVSTVCSCRKCAAYVTLPVFLLPPLYRPRQILALTANLTASLTSEEV
jgi:hypothetical protein